MGFFFLFFLEIRIWILSNSQSRLERVRKERSWNIFEYPPNIFISRYDWFSTKEICFYLFCEFLLL